MLPHLASTLKVKGKRFHLDDNALTVHTDFKFSVTRLTRHLKQNGDKFHLRTKGKLFETPSAQKGLPMKRMFALMCFCVVPQLTGANDRMGWSLPVNGLEARLSFEKGEKLNGTPLIATYLELRNVAEVANVIELPFNQNCMQFEVIDERNELLPQPPNHFDEVFVEIGLLRMPHDSYLRFNISHRGAGVPKNETGLLDLGASHSWTFRPGDKHSYYLRGRLSVEPGKEPTWS